MSPLSLALWLLFGPAGPDQGRDVVVLEQAVISAGPTAESAQRLAEALTNAETQALALIGDEDALALLDRARLALVSIHLALGDSVEAEAAMDEVIRSAMGRQVGAGNFGPVVLELYERRLQALRNTGTSTIAITCQSCEIIINETRASNPELPLYLGRYRVWVVFSDPNRGPEHLVIELHEPGMAARRSFLTSSERPIGEDVPGATQDRRTRLLPRWAELSMASAGAALLIGGVVLAALNGTCRGEALGGDTETCPQLHENHPQDKVLIGLGAGAMVAAGVVLTVDEVRIGRARGRQAMLTWTIQF
ncbi:hypothetical protein [Enhygromyxa salina]|nr:hypothetical protein [Enhygromyxa salina]